MITVETLYRSSMETVLLQTSSVKSSVQSGLQDAITLTIAHLKIALLGGNSEVGNSEYINHQNCPPQLLCIFSVNMAIG